MTKERLTELRVRVEDLRDDARIENYASLDFIDRIDTAVKAFEAIETVADQIESDIICHKYDGVSSWTGG